MAKTPYPRTDRELLRRIERSAGQRAGYKQLVRELGLGGGRERRLLLDQLSRMTARGEIVKTDAEQWALPGAAPTAPHLSSRSRRAPSSVTVDPAAAFARARRPAPARAPVACIPRAAPPSAQCAAATRGRSVDKVSSPSLAEYRLRFNGQAISILR